jgi:hypothetical protein
MSNYKINIDKPTPTKEETSKFKNFDNVVSDYKKLHSPWDLLKELYQNKKLIRIFIVLIAILIAVFFGTHETEEENRIDEKIEEVENKVIE